jgi:hypothetical protein
MSSVRSGDESNHPQKRHGIIANADDSATHPLGAKKPPKSKKRKAAEGEVIYSLFMEEMMAVIE